MVKRGTLILVAFRGAYQKVRPAVVVQSDHSIGLFDSLTVCLLTSDPADNAPLRIPVAPTEANGLKVQSWVQTEKVMTLPKEKAGPAIGTVSSEDMARVDIGLATHLNLYALAKQPGETP